MGPEAKNDRGSGSDTSRDAWPLDVAESRPTQPAAFDSEPSVTQWFIQGPLTDVVRSHALALRGQQSGRYGPI